MAGSTTPQSSSASSTQFASSTQATVTMAGHLIDSLTLTKVIDLIQAQGGDYRLNDIEIGSQKSDLTHVSLNVSAPTPERLQTILEEIRVHGAYPVGERPTQLKPATANGVAPEAVFLVQHLPSRIKTESGWVTVNTAGFENLVVVVSPDGTQASIKKQSEIQSGDMIVTDYNSLEWA